MGWYYGNGSKKELIAELLEGAIDSSVQSNIVYTVHKNSKGENYIRIDKLSCFNKKWGYKPMDESMYPFYFTCPERILAQSTQESGEKWRTECRRRQKVANFIKKKAKEMVKTNSYPKKIEINGRDYDVLGPYYKNHVLVRLSGRLDTTTYRHPIKDMLTTMIRNGIIEVQ